ncbi:hypothetical protein EU528_05305 [Candidatus Thorarchaeota archaeon]|nr:MAG: hypothetical protein EU528_05305 [Candidatus Thorarchaeota archaeon]
MSKTTRILALMFVTFMILSSTQVQTFTSNVDTKQPMSTQLDILNPAAYDSPNITASLVSLANGSTVSGTFDITLDMGSDFTSLNLTLFVEGAIYPAYDHVNISASTSWTEVISSIDSTTLAEGMLNFTVLFEKLAERESVYLLYYVDNDGFDISVALYTPANESEISGLVSIDLNVTADVETLNLTVYIDGEIYSSEFVGTGDISVIVDTSTLIEGYDNFTLFFQYDVLATYFFETMYLLYLVDNDGKPIAIDHQSPANQTDVSGVFDLYLEIGSDYEPLEFTLFVDGMIHEYNKTSIGIKNQIVQINTTGLSEGLLNFTLLFYYNVTGEDASAIYTLVFNVNNHLAPAIVILGPSADSTITGLTDLWLNITTTHPELYLNITVDGEITEEFNSTSIVSGAFNYTFNSSRYDNGHHIIGITAFTGENASSTTEITLIFLDYVRLWVLSLANYEIISGVRELSVRVTTPDDNVTVSFYIDGEPVTGLQNITVYPGTNPISFDTTVYPEGEHVLMLLGRDAIGHEWRASVIIVIDNKGAPIIRYATTNSVMTGVATFVIDIDSDWDELTIEVFVDDVILENYNNITEDVSSGTFTFTIDVGAYAKTEHTVRVVMTTIEGDSSQVERVFGFASLRVEEIASIGILVGLALIIPLFRKKQGYSIKTALMVDAIFAVVVVGAFFVLGISSIPFLLWHVNMASIWAIGGTLVFTNWALPFIIEEPEV